MLAYERCFVFVNTATAEPTVGTVLIKVFLIVGGGRVLSEEMLGHFLDDEPPPPLSKRADHKIF